MSCLQLLSTIATAGLSHCIDIEPAMSSYFNYRTNSLRDGVSSDSIALSAVHGSLGGRGLCSYEVQAQQQLPWWREEWKCAMCGHVAKTEGGMDHHMDGEHQDRLVQVPCSTSAPQCLPHPACLHDCVAAADDAMTRPQMAITVAQLHIRWPPPRHGAAFRCARCFRDTLFC